MGVKIQGREWSHTKNSVTKKNNNPLAKQLFFLSNQETSRKTEKKVCQITCLKKQNTNMKWNQTVFFAVCLMLALSVWEVKSEAKISDLKPNEAEQNFQNIKKTMEISNSDKRKLKKVVADDQLELGSGLLDDKDDYLDDDYEEDDEYYDDDYEDDYEEGSGLNLELEDDYDNSDLFTEQNPEDHANVIPDDKSDLYFEEDKKKTKKVKKDKKEPAVDYDNLLYEYYNEEIYGNDDDDMDYLYEVEKDLEGEGEIVTVTKVWNEVDSELDAKSMFHHSYIFIMLSSALISFAVFTLAFILCRRSKRSQNKKQMVPFVVTTQDFTLPSHTKAGSTPIVKNSYYQRVPTSSNPKELMQIQNSAAPLEAVLTETQKPLLP